MGKIDIESTISEYNELKEKHKLVVNNHTLIKSELQARKNSLKRLMEEAKEHGFDPNNLEQDVMKLAEITQVKIDTFRSELETAKKVIDPMIKEINNV